MDTNTPQHRFEKFAHSALPKNAEGLRWHFSGAGISDYCDTYYFRTTPEEIDRLISEMGLEISRDTNPDGELYVPIQPLPGWPDYKDWEGLHVWRDSGDYETRPWFFYMVTDAAKTQAYVVIGCL